MGILRFRKLFLVAGVLGAVAPQVQAIDAEPGVAIAPPADLNLIRLTYFNLQKGDQYVAGNAVADTRVDIEGVQFRYTRTFELFGNPAAIYV